MTQFRDLLRLLTAARVEFIIVGGVAAFAHGASRVTLDLDVVYRRTPENLDRLVAALAPHEPYPRGAPPGLPFRWDGRTVGFGTNFTLKTTVEVYGTRCLCLDLDHLIHEACRGPSKGL